MRQAVRVRFPTHISRPIWINIWTFGRLFELKPLKLLRTFSHWFPVSGWLYVLFRSTFFKISWYSYKAYTWNAVLHGVQHIFWFFLFNISIFILWIINIISFALNLTSCGQYLWLLPGNSSGSAKWQCIHQGGSINSTHFNSELNQQAGNPDLNNWFWTCFAFALFIIVFIRNYCFLLIGII